MATVLCEWLLNAALRFSFRLVLCVKVNTAILLIMHVHRQCKKVDTGMQCKYVSSHIALGVLLAGGQPLVVAPLFAVNALGGLNCTKVSHNFFKFSLCSGGYASRAPIGSCSGSSRKGCWSHSSLFVKCTLIRSASLLMSFTKPLHPAREIVINVIHMLCWCGSS